MMTLERRIESAKVKIMADTRFMAVAGLLMFTKHEVCDTTPTAGTNGQLIKYGRAFCDKLTDPELRFLVLHELYHTAYGHFLGYEALLKQDALRANMAMDYVINLMLSDADYSKAFISMPEGGLIDDAYRGMDTLAVFKALENKGKSQSQPNSFDEHDHSAKVSPEQAQQLKDAIDRAIRQGAQAAKKQGAGATGIDHLLEPEVNWRDVMREFIKSTCAGRDRSTYRRLNRRLYPSGIYMPTHISERVGRGVVAPDTSGSIGGDTLTAFMSEFVGMVEAAKPEAVDCLVWGSSVVEHKTYDASTYASLRSLAQLPGGGGTEPDCIGQYIAAKQLKPEFVIVLTDGEFYKQPAHFGAPTLWVVVGNKGFVPPFGQVVRLT